MKSRLISSLSLLAFVLFCCLAGFAQDPGTQLFHKMQQALGGENRMAAIRDFEETARADAWDAKGKPMGEVRKRTRWISPGLLRLDQVGPGDTYVLYFDGSSGWEILPDKTVAELAGGELKFAQHYLWSFDLNLWLADRDPDRLISSPAPDVIAISSKSDPSEKIEITLDPKTSLPLKTASISLADPAHPVAGETRFGDWQATGGVQFPRQISNFHGGKKLASMTFEQIAVNRGLKPADLSAKPSDLAPVMSSDARSF